MTAISSNRSTSDANIVNGANNPSDGDTATKFTPSSLETEFEQLRRKLTRVQEQMRQSRDRNALLAITCDRLRDILQASRVLVYRFESESQGNSVAEASERGWTPTVGETLPATFFGRDRQLDYDIADCTAIDYVASTSVTPYQLQLLEKYQVRAGISCPIRMGSAIWGLLSVQQCNEARRWNQSEIGILEQISTALALNLVGYQFQEEIDRQQVRENAATKVITRIRRSLDIKTIFQTTTQEVRQLLKADRVGIYRFNTDWSGKFVAESVGAGWASLMQNPIDPELLRENSEDCNLKLMVEGSDRNGRGEIVDTYLERTKGGTYAKGQKYRIANDIYEQGFPACYIELLERIQARAYLTVGIYQGTKLWGLLATYQCSASRTWERGEIRLLVQIAEQLGVALQQASTLRQQRLQAEKLKKAVEREKTIALTIDRIKQSTEPQTVFRVATESVRKLLKSDRVVVYRFTPDWGGEFVAESVGEGWISLTKEQRENSTILEGTKDNIDTQGCTIKQMRVRELVSRDTYLQDTKGGTYRTGEKYRACNDVYKANFPACYLELLESFQARAYVTVPIFLGNTLWGLLANYQCSGARNWGQEEIDLMVNLGSQLGLALQRAEDMEQVRSQAQKLEEAIQRERTIALISDRIKQSQETQEVFNITTREVRQLLKADRVGIYRFNEDWSGEFIAESVTGNWKSLLREQLEDEKILAGTKLNIDTDGCTVKEMTAWDFVSQDTYLERTQGGAYKTGDRYRACNDIYKADFPRCYVELLERFQAKAYVTVPVFLGKKLWGLMATYQCSDPREWTTEEINLVVNLGSQLSIALQRAQDLERVKAQAKKLEEAVKRERTLALIGDRIKQTQDPDEIFKIATGETRELLQADRVGIYRFNEDWSGEFVAEAVLGSWKSLLREQIDDESLLEATKVNIDSEGCTIKAMATRDLVSKDTYLERTRGGTYRTGERYRVCNDIYNAGFPRCYLELLERFQARAYATVPIFLEGQLWGLMATYQCSGPREWTTEEINLVSSLGSQLGLALERGRDLERVKAQTEKLEKAIERERAIAAISDRIKQAQDIDTIFKMAAREARKVFNSDRVGIYRFNEDWSGEFVAESVRADWLPLLRVQNEDVTLLERAKANIDTEGCTIQQMRVRELVARDTYLQDTEGGTYRKGEQFRASDDIYNSGFSPCYIELLESFQARAYITVPIFLGQKLWGLMANYQCSGPREWESEEIQMMVQLGSQLGLALQRAEDLERLRQQAQQLEASVKREKEARELLQRRAIQLLTAVRPALEGDLTVRAPLSEDELGTIADVYNNTLQSLRKIVMQVQTVTAEVAQSSIGSDTQIRKLAVQARQQTQELNVALDEVQQMVNSSQNVGANAKAIEQAVRNANQTVQSGNSAMNRTVEGILAIRDTVAETSQKIRDLSESSQKIDRVVNLIGDFATQTQLLSLNAAIEATRAGEYGKGFAVVADEVRSLARQSANATSEISNLVAEIRQQTGDAIAVTEAAISRVSAGTTLVEETKGNLNAIAAATAQIGKLVEDITSATQAQLERSQSVTETMRAVADISNSTSAESTELSETFQNSLATAQQLQEVVKQFKVN
ncbi:MAG: GAF domain-containing protein [Cyanobacteria bacterium SBLK]|nr:GAF domain-containing protein [Cyanobacteria bacterium SBLK]